MVLLNIMSFHVGLLLRVPSRLTRYRRFASRLQRTQLRWPFRQGPRPHLHIRRGGGSLGIDPSSPPWLVNWPLWHSSCQPSACAPGIRRCDWSPPDAAASGGPIASLCEPLLIMTRTRNAGPGATARCGCRKPQPCGLPSRWPPPVPG